MLRSIAKEADDKLNVPFSIDELDQIILFNLVLALKLCNSIFNCEVQVLVQQYGAVDIRDISSYLDSIAALGMSLRKVSYEAFVFSVFSRKQEKTKPLTCRSVSSKALQSL